MKKNKLIVTLLVVLMTLLFVVGRADAAQEGSSLQLSLVRNFGYGGLGKIQGNFTLRIASPPADLRSVAFYLDGEPLGRVESPPFQVKFHTGDYQPGEHTLTALGTLEDGRQLESNSVTKTFLSSEQAWAETQGILIPLLVGTALLTLLGLGVPLLWGSKKEFAPGQYGPAGGAVCPRCQLPFNRPVLAPNLLVGKLVRCPHCGKVSILARAPEADLTRAERKYTDTEGTARLPAVKDDLKKMLDESRFED